MNNITSSDFHKPTPYNSDTLNQIWMSTIADGHDIWCNCTGPFAHLLASIFPPGHTDRNLTINQIIQRDYKQQCHSGGIAERSGGGENIKTEDQGTGPENEEGEFTDANVEDLIAAATAAEEELKR